jgi:hypothetical protein
MEFFQRFFTSNPLKEEERRGLKRELLDKQAEPEEGSILHKRRGDVTTLVQSIENMEQEVASLVAERKLADEEEETRRQREYYLRFREGEFNHRHDFRHAHMNNFLPLDLPYQLT